MRTLGLKVALLLGSTLMVGFGGCNNSSTTTATGTGGTATGGSVSGTGGKGSGGASSTGGNPGTGGSAAGGDKGSGGAKGSGGVSSMGGNPGTGGGHPDAAISETGGKGSGGASSSTGGRSGMDAGASGGRTGTGGTAGGLDGGGSTGGTTGSDPVKSDGCGKTSSLKNGNGLKITLKSPGSGDRNYNLKVPDNYDNNHPYRLILSYHWVGGTADDVSNGGVAKPYYGLVDLAQGSTIFAAPDGTPNTIMGNSGNMWANSNGSDVEFSRQLIELLESEFCVDKSRIFCEGFSMGGSMSYAMACGLGDVVRAVAVHSGGTMSGCAKHDKPVAYFMTHGTNDSVCKWPSYPIPLLEDFAKVNGCTDPSPSLSQDAMVSALPTPTDSSGKTPACLDFKGCKEGYPVRACLFVGDHTPSPGGTSGWVPTESWKFLSQF
jgi:predicted esterase